MLTGWYSLPCSANRLNIFLLLLDESDFKDFVTENTSDNNLTEFLKTGLALFYPSVVLAHYMF